MDVKIHYRFVFNCDYGIISRYNKICTIADTYNDILGLTYDKLIELSKEENIDCQHGETSLEYFYVNDLYDFKKNVSKKFYNKLLNNNNKIFHVSFIWNENGLEYYSIKKKNKKI